MLSRSPARRLRPAYGPGEDRNFCAAMRCDPSITVLRPAYGPGEDRNTVTATVCGPVGMLRPAYGPGEDRNNPCVTASIS